WPANERFVAYDRVRYLRDGWRDQTLALIKPVGAGTYIQQATPLMGWLEFSNGPAEDEVLDIAGFVLSTSDALRTNQLVHEYEVPADLGWSFD
ncbi:MAG: hypothetical protein KDB96_19430, partial [Flavobacteriales bacterium]|nr:hypothetical protein [Flavobacteriales bacterium]